MLWDIIIIMHFFWNHNGKLLIHIIPWIYCNCRNVTEKNNNDTVLLFHKIVLSVFIVVTLEFIWHNTIFQGFSLAEEGPWAETFFQELLFCVRWSSRITTMNILLLTIITYIILIIIHDSNVTQSRWLL